MPHIAPIEAIHTEKAQEATGQMFMALPHPHPHPHPSQIKVGLREPFTQVLLETQFHAAYHKEQIYLKCSLLHLGKDHYNFVVLI